MPENEDVIQPDDQGAQEHNTERDAELEELKAEKAALHQKIEALTDLVSRGQAAPQPPPQPEDDDDETRRIRTMAQKEAAKAIQPLIQYGLKLEDKMDRLEVSGDEFYKKHKSTIEAKRLQMQREYGRLVSRSEVMDIIRDVVRSEREEATRARAKEKAGTPPPPVETGGDKGKSKAPKTATTLREVEEMFGDEPI